MAAVEADLDGVVLPGLGAAVDLEGIVVDAQGEVEVACVPVLGDDFAPIGTRLPSWLVGRQA